MQNPHEVKPNPDMQTADPNDAELAETCEWFNIDVSELKDTYCVQQEPAQAKERARTIMARIRTHKRTPFADIEAAVYTWKFILNNPSHKDEDVLTSRRSSRPIYISEDEDEADMEPTVSPEGFVTPASSPATKPSDAEIAETAQTATKTSNTGIADTVRAATKVTETNATGKEMCTDHTSETTQSQETETDTESEPNELAMATLQPTPLNLASIKNKALLKHSQDANKPKPIRVMVLRRLDSTNEAAEMGSTTQEFMVTQDDQIPEYELNPSKTSKWINKKGEVNTVSLQNRIRATVPAYTWETILQDTIEEGNILLGEHIYHVRTITSTESTPSAAKFSNKHKLHGRDLEDYNEIHLKTWTNSNSVTITANTIRNTRAHVRLAKQKGYVAHL